MKNLEFFFLRLTTPLIGETVETNPTTYIASSIKRLTTLVWKNV